MAIVRPTRRRSCRPGRSESANAGAPLGLPVARTSVTMRMRSSVDLVTGELEQLHWFSYTEYPAGIPGKYRDARLAHITRSQTMTMRHRGETVVRETFSAEGDNGDVGLSLGYKQGGMVVWATSERPNLLLRAANDPSIMRWYQEDQVLNVVRSDPLKINAVFEISLDVTGELADVLDTDARVVAVVIQRPYIRQVYVP